MQVCGTHHVLMAFRQHLYPQLAGRRLDGVVRARISAHRALVSCGGSAGTVVIHVPDGLAAHARPGQQVTVSFDDDGAVSWRVRSRML